MPFYSEELIDEIREKNNIVDIISPYVSLKRSGTGRYVGLCPFHSEKTPSFSVDATNQLYYCFGCGAGGNVFTFLQNYNNETFPEAVEELANRAGVAVPKRELTAEERAKQDKRSRLFEIQREAGKYYYAMLRNENGKTALQYFTNRALTPETMQKFGLGYASERSSDLYFYLKNKGYSDDLLAESGLVTFDEVRGAHDKFWNRAMFPIIDQNGKVVAFGGRVLGEGEPKYLNSPETPIFNKSRTLYGLNLARKTRRDAFILCEGYMDVIALHQAGFDNAIASLGTSFTPGHAGLIKRYAKSAFLCYDSDGAGKKAALRAIPILREAGISCRVINMQPYKDPDEFMKGLSADEFEKRIAEAENSFLFTIRMLAENYDLGDPEGKTRFQTEIADRILEFPDEIERDNYLEAIDKRYHFGFEAMKRLVASRAGRGGIIGNADKTRGPVQETAAENRTPRKKEDGHTISEQLLLTWIAAKPELYPKIRRWILPEDYSDGILQSVAEILYRQMDENGRADPSAIVSKFTEDDEQRRVAAIFNTTAKGLSEETEDADFSKALKETVIRVKEQSMERQRKAMDPADMEGLKTVVENKKILEEMKKMRFDA